MKPGKKRGAAAGDARKLVNEQRLLLEEIDLFIKQSDDLSGTSAKGLRQVGSILQQDIRELTS